MSRGWRWVILVFSLAVLGVGGAYVGWWLSAPADCLTVAPASWSDGGVIPRVHGPCPVAEGELVTSATADGYTVVRGGRTVAVPVPSSAPDLAGVLAEGWAAIVFSLSLFGVAAYAFARRPADPVAGGLFLCASSFLASISVWLLDLPARVALPGGEPDWARWAYLFATVLCYLWGFSALLLVVLLFQQPVRWLRGHPYRAVLAFAAPTIVVVGGAALSAEPVGSPAWAEDANDILTVVAIATVLSYVVTLAVRLHRPPADAVGRAQLRWLVAAAWLSAALSLAFWQLPELLTDSPLLPGHWHGLSALPGVLGIAVATLRYRLFGLDVVLTRAVVYATLTACVVTLYLAVVVGAAGLLRTSVAPPPAAIAGAAVAAIAVNPLRILLQRLVNRLFYGDRDDPYSALSRLGSRLAAAAGYREALPAAAADVASALRVPYAEIGLLVDGEPRVAASSGSPPEAGGLRRADLTQRGEVIGWLAVAPREPGEPESPADRRLLADLAGQVASAAREVLLHDDLHRSRERLVLVREEERRALRRTLHDDIGPDVAAVGLRAETARRLIARSALPEAEAVLAEVKRDTAAVADALRRLAYDLRPPSLDEHGLVGALRSWTATGPAPVVVVTAPDDLGDLPAAVEVAAYRIAVEAMTNAARHSGAAHTEVRLATDGSWLTVVVTDDGTGLPDGYRAGVGVTAMRERAAELGGTLTLESVAGGTRVTARLPQAGSP